MTYDVVIAGGGPVGLLLACELRLAGPSVLVLEQAGNPSSPLKGPPFGLRGLSAPSLEAFYRRGLLDDIHRMSATSPLVEAFYRRGEPGDVHAPHWAQTPRSRKPAGHFAGIQFFHDDIDASQWPWRLPSPAGARTAVYTESLEAVLTARAEAMGVDIRRGLGVDGFEPSDEEVAVHAGGATFHGRWLVGCDGGRSTVRRTGGFAFVGTDPEFTGYSVEVELADPDRLQPGLNYAPDGIYSYARPGTIA